RQQQPSRARLRAPFTPPKVQLLVEKEHRVREEQLTRHRLYGLAIALSHARPASQQAYPELCHSCRPVNRVPGVILPSSFRLQKLIGSAACLLQRWRPVFPIFYDQLCAVCRLSPTTITDA